jgi:hypothetical protein
MFARYTFSLMCPRFWYSGGLYLHIRKNPFTKYSRDASDLIPSSSGDELRRQMALVSVFARAEDVLKYVIAVILPLFNKKGR